MKQNFNKFLVTALLLFSVSANAQKYLIKTVAGNGTGGFGPDGPATASKLFNPTGVAADASGNIYIADKSNNRIRKVTGTTISTVVGSGTSGYTGDNGSAATATLSSPSSVAKDKLGNLYIADEGNHVIRKVSAAGIITTFAGPGVATTLGDGGPATAAYLTDPVSVAVDKNGNVFIADQGNARVRMVDGSGNISTYAGTTISGYNMDDIAATTAQLSIPVAVCVDTFGNLYIVDQTNYRIRKVDVGSKIISTVIGTGVGGYSGNGGSPLSAKISYASGVAVDRVGNIFITDNFEVRKVDTHADTIGIYAGRYDTTSFGGDGGLADTSKLNNAQGLATDTSGNLFIADEANQRIREVYKKSTVGVQQIAGQENAISIFPNPNNGTFTIKGSLNSVADESVTLSVMDMTGAMIYKGNTVVQNGAINASVTLERNLANGCYLLNITSAVHNDIARFIIQK